MSRSAEKAYEEIRRRIDNGTFRPDEQLTELELAAVTGVSRTPVREALRRLEAEALIVRSDSKRIFVASQSLSDLEEMYALRALLEGEAAALAAVRRSPEEVARLREINRRIAAAISRRGKPDHGKFIEENASFHATLIDAARSPRLRALLSVIVERPMVRRAVDHYAPEQLARSHAEHDELISALDSADVAWARAVMTGHIRRSYHVLVASYQTMPLAASAPSSSADKPSKRP